MVEGTLSSTSLNDTLCNLAKAAGLRCHIEHFSLPYTFKGGF